MKLPEVKNRRKGHTEDNCRLPVSLYLCAMPCGDGVWCWYFMGMGVLCRV